MNTTWMSTGTIYRQVDAQNQTNEKLPIGVYGIELTRNGFHLNRYFGRFQFKVNGIRFKLV